METVIKIPRSARVFILEDDHERITWFMSKLPGVGVILHKDSTRAIVALARIDPPDIMFLDHDLSIMDQSYRLKIEHTWNSGSAFAKSFVDHGLVARNVVIHSWNPSGAHNMITIFEKYGVEALYAPFGTFDIEVVDEDPEGSDQARED